MHNASVQIRPMVISDYDAVFALWTQSSGMTLRDADSRAAIDAYLQRNPLISQGALLQGTLVGAVLTGTDGRRGYVQHLAVAPASQGKGIGKQLLAACIDALASQGIGKTHLFIHADNDSARQFYRHLGWQVRSEVQLLSFNASGNGNI